MSDVNKQSRTSTGIILLLGAVLMASIYNIMSRKLSLNFNPLEITFVMMWSGAILFNILAVVNHKGGINSYFFPLINSRAYIPVIFLGVFSSVLAFFLLNFTLAKITSAQAAVFANLTTIVAILAGVFIRGEVFFWYQLAGGI